MNTGWLGGSMAESEDWRRQRAVQLGLEPADAAATQSQPVHPSRTVDLQLQASGRETGFVDDGVYRMRPPNGGDAAVPEITQRIGPFGPHNIEIRNSPAKVRPVSDFGSSPPRREPRAAVQIRRKRRTWPFLAGAALVAAIAGSWLAEQQITPSKPASAPVTIAAARSIAPAATFPAVRSADLLQHDISLPAHVVPELPSCAAPAIIDQLRSVVTEQLRRSGLPRTSYKIAVDIAKARIRIAEAGSALTVCTAALNWHRPARKSANFDLDYAVRLPSGMPTQVVPLGLDRIVERIQTDDLNAQAQLARNVAGAIIAPASIPDTAAGNNSRPASRPSSRVVKVAETVRAVPVVALPERGGFQATATPIARPYDLQAKVPKIVHGCEQPATASVAITCSSPALLALNADVTASLSALDHPGNTVELARIKQHADEHFDRCTTTSCVANVYHYWLNALAKIRQYEANYGSPGSDHAREGFPN